jgi:hypothetical protein
MVFGRIFNPAHRSFFKGPAFQAVILSIKLAAASTSSLTLGGMNYVECTAMIEGIGAPGPREDVLMD